MFYNSQLKIDTGRPAAAHFQSLVTQESILRLIQRKSLNDIVRVTVAIAACSVGGFVWASAPPLKIGIGRIVPIAYFDDRGKEAGFAVDVMNEAARREGVTIHWMRLVKGVSADIESGTIDLLSAGMATEERKQKFYVSEPWWFQELSFLTRAGERQPMKRLGLQQVYVEFARPYFDPATFIIDPPNTGGAAANEAKAVCKGTLDGAVITHGELHDLFLNRPEECNGVRLQSVDTAVTYGLSIIAGKAGEPAAKRLRRRIDDLTLDGTLLRLAAAHPPISISGAAHLQERIRNRHRNRIWVTAGCVIALLIAFLAWFLWDRQRDLVGARQSEGRILELNRELDRHVVRLKTLLREKTLLLQEVQHRVKNNLQVISSLTFLQAEQTGDGGGRSALLAMRDRVKSMALIHENLCFSEVLTEIDFAKFVQALAPRLIQSYAHDPAGIRLHTDVEARLRLDEATPCGLIVNELLSNALKHAFPDSRPGDIWISMRQSHDELALEVRDNGIGLPERFSVAGNGSLGLQVVTDLTEQLGGSFSAANASEGGAVFRLTFRRGDQTSSPPAGNPDSGQVRSPVA